MEFISLVSGSSGNSTLITDGKTHILTDCGMSGVKLKNALNSIGLAPENICAILITHEHIDHTKGVGVIARRYKTPIYGTKKTLLSLNCGEIQENLINEISPDTAFEIGNIAIMPFSIPHDAKDPVGYSYFSGNDKFSLATDIGHMNDYIMGHLKGSKKVLLESNHDVEMLQYGSYPFPLKQRILSDTGHLSNANAARAALELVENGTLNLALGHLSNENNTPELAMLETYTYLTKAGIKIGEDMNLIVAKRYEVTKI